MVRGDPPRGAARRDVPRRARARRTGWSASRAAASRPPPTPPCATCRRTADHRRARSSSAAPTSRGCRRASCAGSAPREASMVYQDPGSALNPTLQDRPPGHRGLHASSVSRQARRRSMALDALRRVRIADPERGHAALPAPALGRHAAARRHRHGAGLRPEAARARRADHRARRHRRGRGARPRSRAAQRDRRGDPADRPQPRRDPLDVRPGRRDVRRQDRRGGRRQSRCSRSPSTRTRSACCSACPATACARPSRRCSRSPARCPQIGTPLPTCVFVDRCALADDDLPHRGRRRSSRSAAGHWTAVATTSTGSTRCPSRRPQRARRRSRRGTAS